MVLAFGASADEIPNFMSAFGIEQPFFLRVVLAESSTRDFPRAPGATIYKP
jgi:hypothetical protein